MFLKCVELMFQTQRNVRANRAKMAGHVQMGKTYTVVNAFLDTLAPTAIQVCSKTVDYFDIK